MRLIEDAEHLLVKYPKDSGWCHEIIRVSSLDEEELNPKDEAEAD